MGSARRAASTTSVFAKVSAQSAATLTHYSLQSRMDFLLQAHLPPLTRGPVDAVGAAVRRAYTVFLGKDLLEPEGGSRSSRTRSSTATSWAPRRITAAEGCA